MKNYSRLRFYFLFLYYKLRIPFDCREGLGMVLLSEIIHLVDVVFHTWWEMPNYKATRFVSTIWGKFYFPGSLYIYLIMNPSFERPDMEYFLQRIEESLRKHERVLFLDIGANVGLYSVGMPTRVGKRKLTIHAFEPEPEYFSLLVKNTKANNISDIHVNNVALGNINGTVESKEFVWPGHEVPKKKVKFRIRTLDSLVDDKYIADFDRIFIKMDIEGHEVEAFEGARSLLRSGKKIDLMIEDCFDPTIVRQLEDHGFRLITKITPYNSFWELN